MFASTVLLQTRQSVRITWSSVLRSHQHSTSRVAIPTLPNNRFLLGNHDGRRATIRRVFRPSRRMESTTTTTVAPANTAASTTTTATPTTYCYKYHRDCKGGYQTKKRQRMVVFGGVMGYCRCIGRLGHGRFRQLRVIHMDLYISGCISVLQLNQY
jgi:hypothetical protein